jgi:hypothetical protein
MAIGEPVQIKGAGIRAALEWFRSRHGEAAYEQLLNGLSGDQRMLVRSMLPSLWYPSSLLVQLYQVLASQVTSGRDSAGKFFWELNRNVAEQNLSTVYRAMLFVMSPDRLFDMLPRMWSMYFRGIKVENARDPKARRGTCRVSGIGHIPYMAPGACGWLELAFSKVGSKLTSHEENWMRGQDRGEPLVYRLEWT